MELFTILNYYGIRNAIHLINSTYDWLPMCSILFYSIFNSVSDSHFSDPFLLYSHFPFLIIQIKLVLIQSTTKLSCFHIIISISLYIYRFYTNGTKCMHCWCYRSACSYQRYLRWPVSTHFGTSISIFIFFYIWWPVSTLFLFLPADSSTWEILPGFYFYFYFVHLVARLHSISIFQRYHDQYSFFVLDLDFIWFLHIYIIIVIIMCSWLWYYQFLCVNMIARLFQCTTTMINQSLPPLTFHTIIFHFSFSFCINLIIIVYCLNSLKFAVSLLLSYDNILTSYFLFYYSVDTVLISLTFSTISFYTDQSYSIFLRTYLLSFCNLR